MLWFHSFPSGGVTPFISCIDGSSVGNQVAWSWPFIFIKCSYFFGLLRDGEKQTICETCIGIIITTFQGLLARFLASCSFYQMHSSLYWYQSCNSLLLCFSQTMKAFTLLNLLKNIYLDVRFDLIIV